MFNGAGIDEMIVELTGYQNKFIHVDSLIDHIFTKHLDKLGLPEGLFAKALSDVMAGNDLIPLPKFRKVKNKERLIRVWNVKHDDSHYKLIFETGDHLLLQLCDVGLGWSPYSEKATHWFEDHRFDAYLPTTIDARPKGAIPWNYEIHLRDMAVLWVKKDRTDNMFRWGIKLSTSTL